MGKVLHLENRNKVCARLISSLQNAHHSDYYNNGVMDWDNLPDLSNMNENTPSVWEK